VKKTKASFLIQKAALSVSSYPLRCSAILDSGTTIHIFNTITRFLNFRHAPPGDCVYAGDVIVPVQGYGEVDIKVNGPDGPRIMRLFDVAFCENFACNLVSLRQLRRKGYYWDNKTPNNCLRRKDDSVVCELLDRYDQFVIEDITLSMTKAAFGVRRNNFNSWTERAPSTATERVWHLRLGHPGPEVLNHLSGHSKGVRIKGPSTVECNACGVAKAKRRIRRQARERPSRPGQRFAVDFLDLEPDGEGYWSAMLFTDRYSGYVFDIYLKRRTAEALVEAFEYFLGVLANQYQIVPEVFECDNEITKAEKVVRFLQEERHIRLEPSAPHTQAQNGGAERSGGVIKEKARTMRAAAKFPSFLWVEIFKSAVYLYNRTPKYLLLWQTPYEAFYTYLAYRDGIVVKDRKPRQAHLRAYGCKVFAMSADALGKKKRLQKLNPKAWIGYLVGYNSTNIYRVWNPLTNEVIAVRDVAFNEDEFFSGDITDLKDDLLRTTEEELRVMMQEVRLQEPPNQQPGATTQEEDEELSGIIQEHPGEEERRHGGIGEQLAQGGVEGNVCTGGADHRYSTARIEPLLTPESTPPPAAALLATAFRGLTERKESAEITRCRQEEDARLLLVPPGDNRAIRRRYGVWEAAFNAGRLATPVCTYNGERATKKRLYKIVDKLTVRTEGSQFKKSDPGDLSTFVPRQPGKIHRRDLPPPPRNHKELDKHPMAVGFRKAEEAHLQSHREMQSWIEVDKERSRGHQLLGCMWVYVYKFDKHGWFVKCKARLVVRGDQQAKTVLENTYASTLAGRSFRTLMAIAARFDLELIQYDVVNAFVHAKLPYDVFMRMPPGYSTRGKVLHLQKALYGLRESPLLWQRHFTKTLTRLGFTPVPHEPCCFVKDGVLIFFYVDDIVVAYRKRAQEVVDAALGELKRIYTLQGGQDLQWFLGVEVIRDRRRRLIWLSQSDYLNKLGNLVERTAAKYPEIPMKKKELLPFEGRASPSSINKYQRKTGSILYAAVISRPDIAFCASRLSRFNMNPSEEHHDAADHLIQYLLGTKNFALQLGGGDSLDTWSDSSFADNSMDRKSSQGYVIKLFGGVVGWRANKQDTVTTSTTEAELLSLAQATKEALFASRLIKELGVTLDSPQLNLWCDNQQTIRLVSAEVATLQTKLRHVDIHNHWLRQAVERKQIRVDYTPTGDMLADGLTKALAADMFKKFREQVGLVDVTDRIEARKLKEVKEEDLEFLENSLPGGESDWIPS
jgi:hypothetical protein